MGIIYINHDNVVEPTQALSGNLIHYVVETPNSIVPTITLTDTSTYADKQNYYEQAHVFVEMINKFRLYGNVVIVGNLTAAGFPIALERSVATDAEFQSLLQSMGSSVAFGGSTVDLSGVTVKEVSYDLFVGGNLSKSITFSDNGTILVGSIPNNMEVMKVEVNVTTAFDGTPTITVGDSVNNARLVANSDVTLGTVGTYTTQPNYMYATGSATDLNIYFNNGSATTGAATVTIYYN